MKFRVSHLLLAVVALAMFAPAVEAGCFQRLRARLQARPTVKATVNVATRVVVTPLQAVRKAVCTSGKCSLR